jgi:Uma2 family endonuclease
MVDRPQTKVSAAEFLTLPETLQPTELIDGEIVVSPSPVPQHQRIIFRLASRIDALLPDGELLLSPIDLHLDEDNVVQPDIVWLSVKGRCVVREKWLEGAPALIVEVLSPGTVRRDRGDKFDLYERHGIGEYWLVDPDGQYVEVYTLNAGHYQRQGLYSPGERFPSAALGGKEVDLTGIWGQ